MSEHTILVVEDSPTARLKTIHILESAGYRVVAASDGEEALEAAEKYSPDAVVLDIVLPKKNGYQVCRRLKQDQASLPVLMVTAKDQEKDRIWGIAKVPTRTSSSQCNAKNWSNRSSVYWPLRLAKHRLENTFSAR